jgi:hypothetical protein
LVVCYRPLKKEKLKKVYGFSGEFYGFVILGWYMYVPVGTPQLCVLSPC